MKFFVITSKIILIPIFIIKIQEKKSLTTKKFHFQKFDPIEILICGQIEIDQAKATPSTILKILLNFVKNDNFGIPGILEGFILTLSKHWIPKNGSFDSN